MFLLYLLAEQHVPKRLSQSSGWVHLNFGISLMVLGLKGTTLISGRDIMCQWAPF